MRLLRSLLRFSTSSPINKKKLVRTTALSAVLVIAVTIAAITISVVRRSAVNDRIATLDQSEVEKKNVPPALARKLAAWTKLSPGAQDPRSDNPLEGPTGWAEQD